MAAPRRPKSEEERAKARARALGMVLLSDLSDLAAQVKRGDTAAAKTTGGYVARGLADWLAAAKGRK